MTAIIVPIKGVDPRSGITPLRELAEQLQDLVTIVHDQPYDCQFQTESGLTTLPYAFRLTPSELP